MRQSFSLQIPTAADGQNCQDAVSRPSHQGLDSNGNGLVPGCKICHKTSSRNGSGKLPPRLCLKSARWRLMVRQRWLWCELTSSCAAEPHRHQGPQIKSSEQAPLVCGAFRARSHPVLPQCPGRKGKTKHRDRCSGLLLDQVQSVTLKCLYANMGFGSVGKAKLWQRVWTLGSSFPGP